MHTFANARLWPTWLLAIACGPSVSFPAGETGSSTGCTDDTVACTTTVDGNSTQGASASASSDETGGAPTSTSDSGTGGVEITCPLPDAPNADITVLVDGEAVSFQYAWWGRDGGGSCADSELLVFTPDLSTFVEAWPDLTGGGIPATKFSTVLVVYTRQTVATEYPADASFRIDDGDVANAHGLTVWTKEGDPEAPDMVGEIVELDGEFSASGTFDARWCAEVSRAPCP